ncbi:MAG: pilus assembly protein CpaC [Deltaproteobacteria bacterium]|nr:pilus assembly protein CpaC [Deltaproteobacteria bacterium]
MMRKVIAHAVFLCFVLLISFSVSYAEIPAQAGDLSLLSSLIREQSPGSDVTVEVAGRSLVLKGHVQNEQLKNKIAQLAHAYAPDNANIVNLIVIKDAQQVLLEIRVAQIDKSKLQKFGLSAVVKGNSAEGFGNLIGAPSGLAATAATSTPIFPTTSAASTRGTGIAGNVPGLGSFSMLSSFQLGVSHFDSGVGAILQALQQQDLAKVLAEPNLIVRSGESGKFLVGTRVPIQVVTGAVGSQTASIQYEQVGIKLNFRPEVLDTGVIRLRIEPAEVSNITQFITFAGGISAPVIDTREISTSVDLREGESLILAGLLSEEMKKNIRKVPLLGDIPILGALFRSTSDELTRNELAFFITAKLVKPIPPGEKTVLPAERPLSPEEEKEHKWIPLGK